MNIYSEHTRLQRSIILVIEPKQGDAQTTCLNKFLGFRALTGKLTVRKSRCQMMKLGQRSRVQTETGGSTYKAKRKWCIILALA